ncbi:PLASMODESMATA CALLOSE-BINDING PROTEIN 5-like [Magnolia sinica]|uniref:PLASMODESMATA CALLOSE-BINDING PROTEIN 5-like n=1 Tax=Magnolia sinica TaxID=86752 RepID=UPI0026595B21|nr:PLASMODESMATA CALLOSE-BINDING PROTEIN 5-like [Magnolia sinica]
MATTQSLLPLFIIVSFCHATLFLSAISSEAVQNPNPSFNPSSARVPFPKTTRRSSLESSKALELWCVAKNNAEDAALQSALDWACGAGGADCGPIQQGGACFEPQDIQSHASYAFNNYFLKNGVAQQSCDFSGSAALTSLNPSHGICVFPSSSAAKNGSFTGLTGGTITGVGPAGADLSGSQITCMWVWPLISALMMLVMTVLTLQ